MKFYYCSNCERAEIKSRLESDRCAACGKLTKGISVFYSWHYIMGIVLIFVYAAVLLLYDFSTTTKILGFVVVLAIAVYLCLLGAERMRQKAETIGRRSNKKKS